MSSPRHSTSSTKSESASLTFHGYKRKERRSSASSNSSKVLADLYRSYDGPSDPNCATKQYNQSITSKSLTHKPKKCKHCSNLSKQSVNKDCGCPILTPEQKIAALESALNEAYGGLKIKDVLINLQKTKLAKLHEIVETNEKENENLTYINQRLVDDLSYLKNLIKQYEGKYGKITDEEYEFYTAAIPTSLDTVKGLLLNQNEKLENIFRSLRNAKGSTGNELSKSSDTLNETAAINEALMIEIEDLRSQLYTLRAAAFASRKLIDEITDKSEAYVNAMRSSNASDTSEKAQIRISITPQIHDVESVEDNLLIKSYENFIHESSEKLCHLKEIFTNVYEGSTTDGLATIKFKGVNSMVAETIIEVEDEGREEKDLEEKEDERKKEEELEEKKETLKVKEEGIDEKEEGIKEKERVEEKEEAIEEKVEEKIEEKQEEIEEKKEKVEKKKEEIEEKKEEIKEKKEELEGKKEEIEQKKEENKKEIEEKREEIEENKEEIKEKDAKIGEKEEEEKAETVEEKAEAIEEKVEEQIKVKEEKIKEKEKIEEVILEEKGKIDEKVENKKENTGKEEEKEGQKETKEEKNETKEEKKQENKTIEEKDQSEIKVKEEESINAFAAKIKSIEKVPSKVNAYKLTINNPKRPPSRTRTNNEIENIKSRMLSEIENMKQMSDKLSESLEKERKDWARKQREYDNIKQDYEVVQRERNQSVAFNMHLTKENDDLNTRIEKTSSRFVEEITEYQDNLEEANDIIENLHEQLTSCRTNATIEIRNLNALLLEKVERLEEIEIDYSNCKDECFAKEAQMQTLVDFPVKYKKLEGEVEVLNDRCSDLSGELEVLSHTLEDAVKQRDLLQCKLDEIMCDYDKDKAELHDVTVLKESLIAKVENFEQKVANLTSLNETLKKSYDKSVEEIQKIKYDAVADMNMLKEEIDVLKDTHKEAYRKLQDANGVLEATVTETTEKLESIQRVENIANDINRNEKINKNRKIERKGKNEKKEKSEKKVKHEKHDDDMRNTVTMRQTENENIDIKCLPEYTSDRVQKTDLEKIMRDCTNYRNKLDSISLKIDKHVKEHALYKYETEQKLKQLLLENKFLYQKIEKEACPLLIFKSCGTDVHLQITELQKFIQSAGVHIQEVDMAKMKAVETLEKLKFTKSSECHYICNYDTVNASTSLEKNGHVNMFNKLEIRHIRSNQELGQKVQEIRERKNAALAKQLNQEIIDIKKEMKRDVANNINTKIISECSCTEKKRKQ